MVTCVVGLVFAILWADAEKSKRIDEARAVAEEVGNWFSDELDKALFALYTLRQFVVQTPGMPMIVGLIWLCIRSLLTLTHTIVGLFWLCTRSLLTLTHTPEFEALHAQIGYCKRLETATSPADCEDIAAPPLPGSVRGWLQLWFS